MNLFQFLKLNRIRLLQLIELLNRLNDVEVFLYVDEELLLNLLKVGLTGISAIGLGLLRSAFRLL